MWKIASGCISCSTCSGVLWVMARPRIGLWAIVVLAVISALVAGAWWWRKSHCLLPAVPPLTNPRELTVQAPWFGRADRQPVSGTSRVTIRVSPPDGRGIRVGFYETQAQGTGETWRAASWMAAVVASLATGIDLNSYVPSFSVEGRIDGPSAGALLAVSLMAALQGHELKPGATMTGTIGPDGTVGPVAGVVHKMEAAARTAHALFLIPVGQRYAISEYTGKPIDLLAYGRGVSIEVREVEDLDTAYYLLTGHALPPWADDRLEPSLPEEVEAALRARTTVWLQRYAREMVACSKRGAALRGSIAVDEEIHAVRATAKRAQRYLATGDVAAAYDEAVIATLQAAVIANALDLVARMAEGDIEAIADRLESAIMRADRLHPSLATIASVPTATVDAAVAAADAYGIVAQAAGLRDAAEEVIEITRTTSSELDKIDLLFKAAVILGLDAHVLQIAEDRADLATAARGRVRVQHDALEAWSETLRHGAQACLSYFEATCVDESARELGLHPEVVRGALESQDLSYVLARASLDALPLVQEQIGGGLSSNLAALGASVGAYATASALIAKFYSLRVKTDDRGDIIGVEDREGLERILGLSARKARANIAAARSVGMQAILPTFYYLVGQSHATGDVEEKLEALQCFWQASLYARIGVLLSQRRVPR